MGRIHLCHVNSLVENHEVHKLLKQITLGLKSNFSLSLSLSFFFFFF